MPKQHTARAPSTPTESIPPQAAVRTSPDAIETSPQDSQAQTASMPATTDEQRSVADSRQRGWFWHWNGIVTQYAPLIGLKGVGLLNSYTVWTDRREQSPTRGYAFPSQQSEAAFYGEDRAELITINKILVALDLIEIRKEMVQRIDAKGRRWKVPHNLYRVKDRPDGLQLRTQDVVRVAELAAADAAVYRYVRRVFSSRFSPIDRDNVWHTIIAEVADNPLWQQLAAKTARIEERASARSRAGHKKRGGTDGSSSRQALDVPSLTTGHLDEDMLVDVEQRAEHNRPATTSVEPGNIASTTNRRTVAPSNNAFDVDVDQTNSASDVADDSTAGAINSGLPSVVAHANTTYYQEILTTTTTTNSSHSDADNATANGSHVTRHDRESTSVSIGDTGEGNGIAVTGSVGLDDSSATLSAGNEQSLAGAGSQPVERSAADDAGWGPLVDPGPLVVSLFEAANNRVASPLERILLGELERDAAAPAARSGQTGADWVADALREAVDSGSTFVAPKRIREIINRWTADGRGAGLAPQATPPRLKQAATSVRLPRGRSATKLWQEVLAEFTGVLDPETHERLFADSCIAGYRDGVVDVQVHPDVESKLASEYRRMVERRLSGRLGLDVTVRFVANPEAHVADSPVQPAMIVVSRNEAEQGRQLWRAVLSEIAPSVSTSDLARLTGSVPLGQDVDGCIVIGTQTALATRLIEGRCRTSVESGLKAVLGESVKVRVVPGGSWAIADEEPET